MAAFASCRRSGWVRFFVVLLCALFVLATLGAPAARAEALTVGLFTAAAVLSAATAALGFKLSSSGEGQATLAKMVQDFKVSAVAVGLVLVGSKINGLIDGVDYIKMQVNAGKTYLDERVVAWVQQWLGVNGVYNDNDVHYPTYITGDSISIVPRLSYSQVLSFFPLKYRTNFDRIVSHYNLDLDNAVFSLNMFSYDRNGGQAFYICIYDNFDINTAEIESQSQNKLQYVVLRTNKQYEFRPPSSFTKPNYLEPRFYLQYSSYPNSYGDNIQFSNLSGAVISNGTGLSGTDTIGKDVVDNTLDETLAGLKEWAPDWWDAGADSSTNSAVGAKDLPLNMGSDVKTVTGNPALDVDQPLIYIPWFQQDVGQLRNGETAGTVTNTATSAADTAEKAEAAQGTVEDAQGVVQSIISWGLDYISPDKGLFSRFPLCIPYDAYLLVTAALGVDAQDLGDVVGQSPGELSVQVDYGVAVQSDFVPVISVKHDWTQDGVTTPVEVTIDLRPYDGVIKMIRTLVSVYVIAELIASEYKRIRGS